MVQECIMQNNIKIENKLKKKQKINFIKGTSNTIQHKYINSKHASRCHLLELFMGGSSRYFCCRVVFVDQDSHFISLYITF